MDLTQLYRLVIMDHYKNPRNKGMVDDDAYYSIHLNNPSCGDEIVIQLKIDDEVITDVKHHGAGCSICCSSASVMSETIKGTNIQDANKIILQFYEMIKGMPFDEKILKGDALAYQGVSQFPARIKCATLSWKALEEGIKLSRKDKLKNG